MQLKLTITEILCNKPSSPVVDEFFMFIQADGLPPVRYPLLGFKPALAGKTVELPSKSSSSASADGIVVEFNHGVVITAFDRDFKAITSVFNDNDFLFSFAVDAQSAGGTFSSTNHNGSSYQLTYYIAARS
jgi:hypothetical protein